MDPNLVQIATTAGPAAAALAVFLWGFKMGWWRTSQEVDVWKERATRAEQQVDTLLPALQRLTDALERQGIETILPLLNRISGALERRR